MSENINPDGQPGGPDDGAAPDAGATEPVEPTPAVERGYVILVQEGEVWRMGPVIVANNPDAAEEVFLESLAADYDGPITLNSISARNWGEPNTYTPEAKPRFSRVS